MPGVPGTPFTTGMAEAALTLLANALIPDPARAVITQDPLTMKPGQIPRSVSTKIPVRMITKTRSIAHGASGGGYGNAPHGTHAVARNADEVTLELKWVADHCMDAGPREAREALEELSEKQPDGSFNVVILSWGSLSFRGQFVRLEGSMGPYVDLPTMSEIQYVARVTFRELHQLRADSIANRVGEPSTTYHQTRLTDSWASIAAEHYRNPDASVKLAQVNRGRMLEPAMAAMKAAVGAPSVVRVLPSDHSAMVGPPAPISVGLSELPLAVVQQAAVDAFDVTPGGVSWEDLDPRFTADLWEL